MRWSAFSDVTDTGSETKKCVIIFKQTNWTCNKIMAFNLMKSNWGSGTVN